MDPHFNEYLAAVAGLLETYGDRPDGHLYEVQEEHTAAVLKQSAAGLQHRPDTWLAGVSPPAPGAAAPLFTRFGFASAGG